MSIVARAYSCDEQCKDGKMRQSLGILPGVNGANAEGKESSKNSRHGRVRPAAGCRRRRRWQGFAPKWPTGMCSETNPAVPAGTPSIFAPRQSSQ